MREIKPRGNTFSNIYAINVIQVSNNPYFKASFENSKCLISSMSYSYHVNLFAFDI